MREQQPATMTGLPCTFRWATPLDLTHLDPDHTATSHCMLWALGPHCCLTKPIVLLPDAASHPHCSNLRWLSASLRWLVCKLACLAVQRKLQQSSGAVGTLAASNSSAFRLCCAPGDRLHSAQQCKWWDAV